MATFLKNFFLVKKYATFLKYGEGGGWGGGVTKRRACVIVGIVLVFYISDKIDQIGILHLINFHFSLSIFKNGVKNGVKTLFCMIAG